MTGLRPVVAIVLALLAGLGLGYIDSRPGFDDTGLVVGGLVLAAFVAVLIEGSGRALRVAMLAVLVGIWIPILETSAPWPSSSLISLIFAGAGAAAGMLLLRSMSSGSGGADRQADRG